MGVDGIWFVIIWIQAFCDGEILVLDDEGFVWSLENRSHWGPFAGAKRMSCKYVVSEHDAIVFRSGSSLARFNLPSVNDVAEWNGGLLIAHDAGLAHVQSNSTVAVKIARLILVCHLATPDR